MKLRTATAVTAALMLMTSIFIIFSCLWFASTSSAQMAANKEPKQMRAKSTEVPKVVKKETKPVNHEDATPYVENFTGVEPAHEASDRAAPPPRRTVRPRESIPSEIRDHRRDHRVDEAQALQQVAAFKEWMIGANRTGQINYALNPNAPRDAHYSLKGLEIRKFLFKKPRIGRITWSSDASAQVARDHSQWLFYPMARGVEDLESGNSISRRPLRYGERFALVWQPFTGTGAAPEDMLEVITARTHLWVRKRRSTSELKYDWAIVGGKKGTAVRMGTDRVVLFNITGGKPLRSTAKPTLDDSKDVQLDEAVWQALLL